MINNKLSLTNTKLTTIYHTNMNKCIEHEQQLQAFLDYFKKNHKLQWTNTWNGKYDENLGILLKIHNYN